MPQYRIITYPSGKAWTEWRATRAEAVEDAVSVELAERDEQDPATLYWDSLALIEVMEDDGSRSVEDPHPRPVVASPLPEWELWACADTVMRQHGDRAAAHVAERIGELIFARDAEGVATWQAIARRIQSLSEDAPRLQ